MHDHDASVLRRACFEVRLKMLGMSRDCKGPTHLGGGLSLVEILVALYGSAAKISPDLVRDRGRDRIILSKGHGVLGLYAVLNHFGFFTRDKLTTFKLDGGDLPSHPVRNLDLGIESSNGSLGHGLAIASGIATAARFGSSKPTCFVILGDGECDEGAVWEGALLAANLSLSNLVAIVDINGLKSDGNTTENQTSGRLRERWTSCGWNARVMDGHDVVGLARNMREVRSLEGPSVLLAETIKGKGINFMENDNAWHHSPLSALQYEEAIRSLESEYLE